MAIEEIRDCGYRKVGGIYLEGHGISVPCDRLPFNLEVCPVCGQGIKFTQGWTWIQSEEFLGGIHQECRDKFPCPICEPNHMGERAGLLWVGEAFYSPQSFIDEAQRMGISKRIGFIPRDLKLGETWVLFAHKKAGTKVIPRETAFEVMKKSEVCPAIFYAFKPERIVMLIWKSEATPKKILDLNKRGITVKIVPDNDPDHDPSRSIWTDIKLHKSGRKGKQEKL